VKELSGGDIGAFKDWLLLNKCLDVCMESTGKYWIPMFNILEKHGIRVTIANPKWVKAVKEKALRQAIRLIQSQGLSVG